MHMGRSYSLSLYHTHGCLFYPSIYLSLYAFSCLSIYILIPGYIFIVYPSVYLSLYSVLSIYTLTNLCIHLSVHASEYLSLYMYIHISTYLCIQIAVHPYNYLSLFVHLYIFIFVSELWKDLKLYTMKKKRKREGQGWSLKWKNLPRSRSERFHAVQPTVEVDNDADADADAVAGAGFLKRRRRLKMQLDCKIFLSLEIFKFYPTDDGIDALKLLLALGQLILWMKFIFQEENGLDFYKDVTAFADSTQSCT